MGGSGNRKNLWDISYSPLPVPSERTFAPYSAFFVTTTCEGNLHHFLQDEYYRIFTLMKKLGLLSGARDNNTQNVALFYRDDVHSFCRE